MDPTWLAQLTAYVRAARAAGQTYEQVRQALLSSGWSEEAVGEYLPSAWAQAEASVAPPTTQMPYTTSTPPVQPSFQPPGGTGMPYVPPGYGPSVPSYPAPAAVAPPGLGAWLNKGWEMMTGAAWTIIGASFIMVLISVVSLGICFPPLSIGLYMMLLKRHDQQPIFVGDVFEGFRYFWRAWGAFLLAMLIGFIIGFVVTFPLGFWTGLMAAIEGENIDELFFNGLAVLSQVISAIIYLFISPFLIFVFPFIADSRGGVLEAFSASFQTGKRAYGLILLTTLFVNIIVYAGIFACFVGTFFTTPLGTCILTAMYRTYFPARGTRTGY